MRTLDWAIKKDEIGTTLKSSSFSIKMSNEKDFKEVRFSFFNNKP